MPRHQSHLPRKHRAVKTRVKGRVVRRKASRRGEIHVAFDLKKREQTQ